MGDSVHDPADNADTHDQDVGHWADVGEKLATSAGVHRPSVFSALLASILDDVAGQVVIDAGCGAGLVSIAALSAGASHVIAQDIDAVSLADTAANVEKLLGENGRSRLTLWEADWRLLQPMRAGLLAVNPPQRPTSLRPDVDPGVRHLHDGGGLDGFDGLRLVLGHASASTIRTTAASVLDMPAALPGLLGSGWETATICRSATLTHDPAWRRMVPELRGRVDVWGFTRRDHE